jgi:hypothetical protein
MDGPWHTECRNAAPPRLPHSCRSKTWGLEGPVPACGRDLSECGGGQRRRAGSGGQPWRAGRRLDPLGYRPSAPEGMHMEYALEITGFSQQ